MKKKIIKLKKKKEEITIKEGAGFWIRAAAKIIDVYVVNIVLNLVVGLLFGFFIVIFYPSYVSTIENMSKSINVVGYLYAIIGVTLYESISESVGTTTVGKQIFKLRVLTTDGKPPEFKQAFIRSIAFFVDSLFFGVVAYISMSSNKLNQRFGDKWAKTVVVYKDNAPKSSIIDKLEIKKAISFGLIVWAVIIFWSLLASII